MVEAIDEGSPEWGVCEIASEQGMTGKDLPTSIPAAIPQLQTSSISLTRDFTYKYATETGSMQTTAEEASNLANDPVVGPAIQSSSTQYAEALTHYRAGTITFAQLQKEYSTNFSALLSTVEEAISKDTTGKIFPIKSDYDDEHQKEYTTHLQVLIGLAQNILKIPAYQCLLPPNSDSKNLLINGDFSKGTAGWAITAGSATLQANTPDPYDKTSPVENKSSLSFSDMPPSPGYVTVSQTVPTTPGHTYVVSGYIIGTPPESADAAFSGGVGMTGAKSITSSITGKTIHFPQTSNEIYHDGIQRRYFWTEATGTEMTINLYGGPQTVFKNVSVIEVSEGDVFKIAQALTPPTVTTGDPEVGHYPQIESVFQVGDNLIDGAISFQKNIDQAPLKNAGHPYWFIDDHNPANHGIKITNAQNNAHGLYMPLDASVTTNGPVPCPVGQYTYSMQVFVPGESNGKVNIQFTGTTLIDNAHLPKISKDFDSLTPGTVNSINFPIDTSFFKMMPKGTFFRPTVIITNNGEAVTVFGAKLSAIDSSLYDQVNRINPYNPKSPWYQSQGFSQTYDFKKGPVDPDWAVALTGNTMFSPGTPASDYTQLTPEGVVITSIRDNSDSPPYSNGGIQSTQFLPSGQNFSISMQFTASTSTPDYEPTLALWTYGESQRGPENPIFHTNAPGADPITEFDCEMGSDPTPNTPPPAGTVYARDGSYIGHAEGGHQEYLDEDSKGNPIWKPVPDFWDTHEHTLTMEGSYSPEGHLILTRLLDGKEFSKQDVGPGPFSPTYIKIALENPNWNSRGKTDGTAKVTIENISVSTQPPTGLNEGVTIPEIPIDEIDYAWFTPGGGGSPSYTPFPDG
ncbi:MAG: hypothetical protein KFB93_03200 [Simkaniaceae bacterium]|nr:MAG: hypothetical protein KFB93_03200 [Simkaniaceae bacterium]